MLIKSIIRLSNDDMADRNRLSDAFHLVGGAAAIKDDDAKPFGRIAGNDFTMEDAERALEIIRARRDELHERSNDPVFLAERLQTVFAEGVRANADHAVRLAENFVSNLRDDVAAYEA